MNGNRGIVFEVETTRILKILTSEIYDSPLALLRENLQNAYDAVRMRFVPVGSLADGRIDLTVSGNTITISDNGIGMTEDVLRYNFWKTGSSGKHSDAARRAGVVGTFGIGAMANFGVCSRLEVRTRTEGSMETLISKANRDDLRISTECITLERSDAPEPLGTKVIAVLDSEHAVTLDQARNYLEPYVCLLPVPVYVNDTLISGKSMESRLPLSGRQFSPLGTGRREQIGDITAHCAPSVDPNGQLLVQVTAVTLAGQPVEGSAFLLQSGGQLMGLRSRFGLAPIPATGHYQFGGFADFAFLQPTAGREAVSRESIQQVGRLVEAAERVASEELATSALADRNTGFLNWVVAHRLYDLAHNVTVRLLPDNVDIPLAQVKARCGSRVAHYYVGADAQIIQIFAGEGACLLHIAQGAPRRNVQLEYIRRKLNIPEVPDSAKVVRRYKGTDLTAAEASICLRATSVLREDYLIPDIEVGLADISHGVAVLPEQSGEHVHVHLARSSRSLLPLKQVYQDAYEVYGSIVKDFVRNQVYPRIQQHVPSSTRHGVDALRKMLERNRELYRYEEAEFGQLESVLGDYLSGNLSMSELLQTARSAARIQPQTVTREQVGTVENVVPDVVQSPVEQPGGEVNDYSPRPPIMREEMSSDMKILEAGQKYVQLNNFSMLLGLSDRLMKMDADFFRTPHTTRIIWGGHRVIYIFTEASGRLSLYYDIELREPLENTATSGGLFPTTTLITRKRIFVPVPDPLIDAFRITTGSREFYVRFDILVAGER